LAGVGPDVAERCTEAERLKWGAIGFTVLVPTLLALFSAGYAVSLLTPNPLLVGVIALGWAFIVLTIDRGIVATLRESLPMRAKAWQFSIRLGIAILMALTISHPLTLLLFQPTVQREVERALREEAETEVFALERKIREVEAAVTSRRKELDIAPSSKFASASASESPSVTNARSRLADLRARERELANDQASAHALLQRAEEEYTNEVNGTRQSGVRGEGTLAKNIKDSRIVPLTATLDTLKTKDLQLQQEIRSADLELAEIQSQERSQRDAERAQFLAEQTRKRKELEAEMVVLHTETERLKARQLEIDHKVAERIEAMQPGARNQVRPDLLTQTMALHGLFEDPERGGHLALVAFVSLLLLFLSIDAMPIIVKFSTKRGEYDEWIDFHHDLAATKARAELAGHASVESSCPACTTAQDRPAPTLGDQSMGRGRARHRRLPAYPPSVRRTRLPRFARDRSGRLR
jgi:hypothetical protein